LNIPIIYFSSSNNTKYIAQLIASGLKFVNFEPKLIPFNKLKIHKLNFKEIEIFGVGAPIYSLNFTPNIIKWIETLPKTMKKTKFFLFDTYGGLPGAAIKNIKKILEKKNYKFIGALEIKVPTGISVFKTFLLKFRKWPRESIERSFQFGIKLGTIIKKDKGNLDWSSPSPLSKITTAIFKIIEILFNKIVSSLIEFNSRKCNICKACEKLCPTNAISYQERPIINRKKCIACFRCLRNCPNNALFLKLIPKAKYFRGPKTVQGYISPQKILEEYQKTLKVKWDGKSRN